MRINQDSEIRKHAYISKILTDFQPSGSRHAKIFVLIPGSGPGSRVIFPPAALTASAVLYTSSVPMATCQSTSLQS
jgi:hypothetical protein